MKYLFLCLLVSFQVALGVNNQQLSLMNKEELQVLAEGLLHDQEKRIKENNALQQEVASLKKELDGLWIYKANAYIDKHRGEWSSPGDWTAPQ